MLWLTVKVRSLPVFRSLMSSRYLLPSMTIFDSFNDTMSEIRIPRLASSISAVAIFLLGLNRLHPSFITLIIATSCSSDSAVVLIFPFAIGAHLPFGRRLCPLDEDDYTQEFLFVKTESYYSRTLFLGTLEKSTFYS